MTTFALTPTAIRSIATLHHATPVGKAAREATPILTAIHLTVTPERWTAIATDRYIVGEVTGEMGDFVHTLPDEGITLQLASTDMVDLAKRVKREGTPVQITADSGVVTAESAGGLTLASYRTVAGHFPPVARMFPTDESSFGAHEMVAFAPDFLTRLGKIQSPADINTPPRDRDRALKFRFTSNGSGKPGPALVTGTYDGFRGMIQPRLILN